MNTTGMYASEDENVLKGVMLERISQFITYKQEGDFVVCTYKDENIFDSFEQLFQNRSYQSKPIHVKNIKDLNKANSCDILYLENPSANLASKIKRKSFHYTLLVTDKEEFLDNGFMLALFLEKKKIKFSINQQALVDAKLKVNYRLLRVASKIVKPVKN